MSALRWHWVISPPPQKLKLASFLMQDLIGCIEMRSLSTYAKIEGAIIKQKIKMSPFCFFLFLKTRITWPTKR